VNAYNTYKSKDFILGLCGLVSVDVMACPESDRMRVVITHCDGVIAMGQLSLADAELYLNADNVRLAVAEDVLVHLNKRNTKCSRKVSGK
jgi:hypothetical protein